LIPFAYCLSIFISFAKSDPESLAFSAPQKTNEIEPKDTAKVEAKCRWI